jgi:hypothetical protein
MVDGVAVARLYGEPLFALPNDLYIPPDALEVFLEAFQGPLDLLLYLIRKQNFNILDIPMADVTRQYLAYVDQIRAQPRTGGRLPADGGHAHRDQVAHAAAAQAQRERRGARGPAGRAGAPPAGVRADEAGRRAAGQPAGDGPRLPARRSMSSSRWRRASRTSRWSTSRRPGATSCAAPSSTSTTASRASSSRCAST